MIKEHYTYEVNKKLLIELFRTYEKKNRITSNHMFKFYRLRLQNKQPLSNGMIDHIMKFIHYDVDLPTETIRSILERFKKVPDEVEPTIPTLENFM